MITKSSGFGNCGNKAHTNFGENAFDKINVRGNYRIAEVAYNTLTGELTINQYPDVSKTVTIGESSIARNTSTSHKDTVAKILDWVNMGVGDLNNLDKTKNYIIYNVNNPSGERYLYYSYSKVDGEWKQATLENGDEFFNLEDGIKYRYENDRITNVIDVKLSARNTVSDGKSTGISLEVSPTTGGAVHLDLVGEQYAGLMSPEDKLKLDTVESKIGSVLELGSPVNGKVPLYLKTITGDVLSTVNLDEDDYIESIVASVATVDDPDHGVSIGDRILTFTLTNGNKIVVSLEGWFIKYSGLKTDAINTEVVEDKVKATLLLDPNVDNLSEITQKGLLTKLDWQAEDKPVKFFKGTKASYDSILYSGYIYFTSDTKEVIVDGVAYGIDLTASDLDLVAKLEKDTTVPGRIKVTKSNGGVYNIDIPLVSTTADGLMRSADKAKLDGIQEGAQVNLLEGIKVNDAVQPISNKVATLNVYDKSQVNSLVANGIKYKGESVSVGNLPTLKDVGDTYRIINEKLGLATGAAVYWDGSKWSTFTGNLDLSEYATKQDLENSSSGSTADFNKKLDGKVDKVTGSSLVLDTEIDKLLYVGEYVKAVGSSTIQGKINLDITTRTPSNKGAEVVDHIVLSEASSANNGLMSSKHYDVVEALNLSGNYLDKTGTPSATWQLSKATGPKIKNSGGQFELRNAADDTYADLIVKDLTITGNVTQEGSSFITQAETVEVTDNTILLNKGEVGAGVTKGYAGLEVDRGTSPMYKIYFDESDDRFKAGSGTDLWPIMLRNDESTLTDGNTLIWDATNKRAKTGKNLDTELAKYLPLAGGVMTSDAKIRVSGTSGITRGNSNEGFMITSTEVTAGGYDNAISIVTDGTTTDLRHVVPGYTYKIYDEGNLDISQFAQASEYLPLTAGVNKPLTDNLHVKSNSGTDTKVSIEAINQKAASLNLKSGNSEWIVSHRESLNSGNLRIGDLSNGQIVQIAKSTNGSKVYLSGSLSTHSIEIGGKVYLFHTSNSEDMTLGNSEAILQISTADVDIIHQRSGKPQAKIWDSENDGAGSGLDADTLDNYHASSFMSYNGSLGDLDVATGTKIYGWGPDATNKPNDYNYGSLVQWGNGDNLIPGTDSHWVTQLASTTDDYLYYRTRTNTMAWTGWKRIASINDIPTTLPASDVYAWAKASSKPSYDFSEITNASVSAVSAGTTSRKILISNVKPEGFISRASIGLTNPSNAFSPVILGVATNDAGTSWTDYTFNTNGRLTSPAGTFALTSELANYYPNTGRGFMSIDSSGRPVMVNSQGYSAQKADGTALEILYIGTDNNLVIGGPAMSNSIPILCYQAFTSANGFYDTSDARLKSNIKDIELSDSKIELKEFDKGDRHSYGVIAQQVEELYPSVVIEGADGFKTVNYNEVLTIKCAELEAENKELKNRLDKLEQLLIDKGVL